jgi:hypothetical protein
MLLLKELLQVTVIVESDRITFVLNDLGLFFKLPRRKQRGIKSEFSQYIRRKQRGIIPKQFNQIRDYLAVWYIMGNKGRSIIEI